MSIESTRLVIGSVKRDGIGSVALPPICVKIFPVDPRTNSFYLAPGLVTISTTPENVGQIVAYYDSNFPNHVRLFIAADSTTWYPVNMASLLVDPRTGRPYDPNAEFYNPLAS